MTDYSLIFDKEFLIIILKVIPLCKDLKEVIHDKIVSDIFQEDYFDFFYL